MTATDQLALKINASFACGIALCAPFLVNPLPTWVAALFTLPLAYCLFTRRSPLPSLQNIEPLIAIILMMIAIEAVALLATGDPFAASTASSLRWAVAISVVALLLSNQKGEAAISGLFFGLCPAVATMSEREYHGFSIDRISPSILLGTVDGAGSRSERWALAMQLIAENGWLTGSGFAYHQIFSCAFVGCAFVDYPHAPILSAWLAFGVLGLVLALAFYGVIGLNMLRSGREGLSTGATFAVLATMPYSLISGDTILSLPAALAVVFLSANLAPQIVRLRSLDLAVPDHPGRVRPVE